MTDDGLDLSMSKNLKDILRHTKESSPLASKNVTKKKRIEDYIRRERNDDRPRAVVRFIDLRGTDCDRKYYSKIKRSMEKGTKPKSRELLDEEGKRKARELIKEKQKSKTPLTITGFRVEVAKLTKNPKKVPSKSWFYQNFKEDPDNKDIVLRSGIITNQ
ncbi:hypothetical protein DFA_00555 [Cavenderia fasciculata]|uniref:Uncharacterized protein n=1 Tax=Cavenderia fasciculata TaxID=261658 RepID=F4PSK2_CACFS|nr:uncharacterized protein DFA_00555 [Cavenderia fasciculata]EGG20694.1 hypothetical protein DFA_00555 [Cavenderia fasciculata]|eukprot:XP_004358544.1 hypothetical protein DFA_00555 [Cavenderia fasciculata]